MVFACKATPLLEGDRPRGSLASIRRGSLDVRSIASDDLRRTSLAKLQELPLEAPITKVRLKMASESSSMYTGSAMEKLWKFSWPCTPSTKDATRNTFQLTITISLIWKN